MSEWPLCSHPHYILRTVSCRGRPEGRLELFQTQIRQLGFVLHLSGESCMQQVVVTGWRSGLTDLVRKTVPQTYSILLVVRCVMIGAAAAAKSVTHLVRWCMMWETTASMSAWNVCSYISWLCLLHADYNMSVLWDRSRDLSWEIGPLCMWLCVQDKKAACAQEILAYCSGLAHFSPLNSVLTKPRKQCCRTES